MPQQRIQIFNGRSGKKNKGQKKSKNPATMSFLFNGRGQSMSKKNKGKKRNHGSNPSRRHSKGRHHHKHGRNAFPRTEGRGGTGGEAISLASAALTALIEEAILGYFPTFNSGVLGYVGDIAIGAGLFFLGGFMSRNVARGAVYGTGVKLAIRVGQDIGLTSPAAVSANYRDAQAAAAAAQAGGQPALPPAPGPMQGLGRPGPLWKFSVPNSYPNSGPGVYGQQVTLSGMGRGRVYQVGRGRR